MRTEKVSAARVLQVLREQRRCSRPELGRRTGLSAATISQITADLIDRNLLRSVGTEVVGRGRPVEILEYVADARFALGVEVHDHAVFGVKTDLFARPMRTHSLGPIANGPEAVVDAIVEWVDAVLADEAGDECVGIGLALPGLVDQRSGTVKYSTEFDLPSFPVVDQLAARLPLRPVATNRAYAAALAELWIGNAQDADHVVYLRFENSLGGAILIDRLPFWGSNSAAGAIAHLPVEARGLPCRCGSSGCVETVASGAVIARRAREFIKRGRRSALIEQAGDMNSISADMVIRAAIEGDEVAVEVVSEAVEWLGMALGSCVNLLGPSLVVVGGRLGSVGGEYLAGLVDTATQSRVFSMQQTAFRVVSTGLGTEAIACGAAATALLAGLSRSVALHSPLE